MKKLTAEWLAKAEDDLATARKLLRGKPVLADQVAFHSQQAVEKFLKALLQEWSLPVPRTHDIPRLIDLLLPTDNTLRPMRRGTKSLTRYAVEYRYPGLHTSLRQARTATQKAGLFRKEVRKRLGL
jgi:HEPN domain-containing protein